MAEERQIGIPEEPLDYTSDLSNRPYELDENKYYDNDRKHEIVSSEMQRTVVGDKWKIPTQPVEMRSQLGQAAYGLKEIVDLDSFGAKEYIKWRTDPGGTLAGYGAIAAIGTSAPLSAVAGGGAVLTALEKTFPETFSHLKPAESEQLTRGALEERWDIEIQKESKKLEKARADLESGKIPQQVFDAMQRNFDTLVSRKQKGLEKVDKYNKAVEALDSVPYPNKKFADASVVAATEYLQVHELNKAIEMAQKGIDPESTGFKITNLVGPTAILAGSAWGANYLARYGLPNTLKRLTTDIETKGGAARLSSIKPVRSRREAAKIGEGFVQLSTAELESTEYAWETIKNYIERTGDKTLSEFNPEDLHAFMGAAYGAIAGKIETMGGIENIAAGGMRKLGVGGFLRRTLATGAEEMLENPAQDLAEFMSRKINNTTDETVGEFLERLVSSAAWSGAMGIGFGTIGGVAYRNARRQGTKVLQEYGLSRETAEKVFDNMVDQVADSNSPENESVRDNIRAKVAAIYENIDLSPVELEDTVESITDLEMAFIAQDSAEKGIDMVENPILQGEVNQIGWFREGIPEQVSDQVRTLNDEITNLRQQLREENAKETKDFNKIDDLEAKIEQFYAKLPKEISDLVETDRAKVRQMLDEQMARARDLQDRRKVVRQVQQRALKALQREQESDVQKSLRRLQEESRTEEQKARAEERKQWQEQRKLRKAIEKLRQDMVRRKNKLPVSQELFADADLVYQALRDSGFTNQEISTMTLDNIVQVVNPYGILRQSGIIDLTQDFNDYVKSKKASVSEYIKSLVGQVLETSSEPLKIKITQENKKHIINPRKQGKTATKRHMAALEKLEDIISNAVKTGESDVDLSHNTNKKTLAHKEKVDKYIYFTAPIKIGNQIYYVSLSTEQIKGQDKNILDLYDVKVKKEPDATQSVGLSGSYTDNITPESKKVKKVLQQTKVSGKGKDFRGFYSPELRLISLSQNADPTTLSHELAHDWMQQFFRHYRSGKASDSFMKSWGAVEKALGITENDITVPDKASEAFARAYEAWVMNKKDWAKNLDIEDKDHDKMVKIFERYQSYLTDMYEDLNNPYFLETWGETGKLKPELQEWFDKVTSPTDLIEAQVQSGKITPEEAQVKAITKTVNEVVQAVENEFTPEEKEEIAAVERMNDTKRYEAPGGNKNSLQNRLSGLARDIDANNIALKRYDTHRDMLEVAKAADDFVKTRRDEAMNIINGLAPETEGLYASDLYTALERVATETNDVDLALDLINSKVAQDLAKEWGQRVAGFRNFTGDGNFDAISQLKALDNQYKKDYDEKGKQRVETAADEYVEELNKADDSQDVDAFLDSIKCQ